VSAAVLAGRRDGVLTLTLNRPEVRNALNPALLHDLREVLEEGDADPDVHAIVLTGADPAFCAGVDLRAIGAGEFEGTEDEPKITETMRAVRTPLIGAVNGPAATGGLELALGCDFLIASERARFADTHARVGLLPLWGLSALLPARVGTAMAKELSVTARFVDAAEALRVGLVNAVVVHESLLDRAHEVAAEIGGCDADAVAAVLELYDAAERPTLEEQLRAERERSASWTIDREGVAAHRPGAAR
jgi:enoyl-CoA hydratase